MYTWTFTQTEGKATGRSGRKTLLLSGWSAPHGRQRKDPIFTEVVKSRVQTTYYPGTHGRPARHAFGTNSETIELKGRWMTPQLRAEKEGLTASAMALLWKEFVTDERQCTMSWGPVLSYSVYIEELSIARESEHQIAWKMKIAIDSDDSTPSTTSASQPVNLDDAIKTLKAFDKLVGRVQDETNHIDGGILEFLDSLINLFKTPMNLMRKIIGEIGDVEKATNSVLNNLSSAIHESGRVEAELNNLLRVIQVDANNFNDSFTETRFYEPDGTPVSSDFSSVLKSDGTDTQRIGIARLLADYEVESRAFRATLAGLQRVIDARLINTKSQTSKVVLAKDGDTWESITMRATGGLDAVDSVRDLNGGQYGDRPVPGENYIIP